MVPYRTQSPIPQYLLTSSPPKQTPKPGRHQDRATVPTHVDDAMLAVDYRRSQRQLANTASVHTKKVGFCATWDCFLDTRCGTAAVLLPFVLASQGIVANVIIVIEGGDRGGFPSGGSTLLSFSLIPVQQWSSSSSSSSVATDVLTLRMTLPPAPPSK